VKLYAEDNEAIPAIEVLKDTDTPPAGFSEITSIELWERYGRQAVGAWPWFRDYKALRAELGIRVNTKAGFDPSDPGTYTPENWSKLDAAEQEIAARYFLVPEGFRATVYTMDEQIELGAAFHANACAARDQRFVRAMAELYCRLSLEHARETEADLQEILKGTELPTDQDHKLTQKAHTKALGSSYRSNGIEGSIEDNGTIGLFDYLLSRTGTPFEGNGFASKAWPVIGMASCAELADHLYAILYRGEY